MGRTDRSIPGATIDFQFDVIAAFNDFVLSWAQREPGRFIPLAVVPYWDVDKCVKEIERCADLGHKGFVMSGTPSFTNAHRWPPATGIPCGTPSTQPG